MSNHKHSQEKQTGPMGKNIYILQFGTGTAINLLPLAAGQLAARLKQEKELLKQLNLREIIFKRPDDPSDTVSVMEDAGVVGFSCFLWNMNVSLRTAEKVREKFPEALIVVGGPSIPKEPDSAEDFFDRYPAVDVVCIGEGEDVFVDLCRHYRERRDISDIPGIIYRDRRNGKIIRTGPERLPSLEALPSPYLDGTFDDLYAKHSNEFSGIIWETNRGCPYGCAFCTWGNLPSKKMREKPMDQVEREIEWIGRHNIKYIAMSDSNFGIRERDVELAEMLAECKKKYGVPNFISVSWTKNAPEKILKISDIFKKSGIGFRVTSALQSLQKDVIKAVNRTNIRKSAFDAIKASYRQQRLYSYTELILGLPMETHESFVAGIENSLSSSVFDQLYVYPLFLFPNTKLASRDSRKKFGIESRVIENRYTKSKSIVNVKEFVEIVVGTSTMPKERWIDSFVIGYFTLAIHDDRLAFFILNYLKTVHSIKITDLVIHARRVSAGKNLPVLKKAFLRLEDTARGVQEFGHSHLIEPAGFKGIPYDPPEGVFLELLMSKRQFYAELRDVIGTFLEEHSIIPDVDVLDDLFVFQNAAIAHPDGPDREHIQLKYDWSNYFAYTFSMNPCELRARKDKYRVIDPKPSNGDALLYLKNSFDVRGVPAFNEIYDHEGKRVFPIL